MGMAVVTNGKKSQQTDVFLVSQQTDFFQVVNCLFIC